MEILLMIPILLSIFLTLVTLPKWIKKCKQIDMLWENMNRYNHPKEFAASGGIVVIMAFVLSVFCYIAIRTFILKDADGITIKILSVSSIILFLAIVGLVDDLLGWKHGGLSWRFRLILAFLASIPLVVINAGDHIIDVPFLGLSNLGLFYTLILIPLGIAGATTTYNFLAGFNGLEAGQGIIVLSFLSFVSYITGNSWLALIGLIMVSSLIVFYYYNKYPASVLPGDSLTYAIGALIACMAILGNFEKVAVFIFIPYILETLLKAGRGKLKKHSFGIPDKNNNLSMAYEGKIYGLTHLSIWLLKRFKEQVKEKDVVYLLFAFQIVICLLALIVFRSALFT